jgi:hypothetical protein
MATKISSPPAAPVPAQGQLTGRQPGPASDVDDRHGEWFRRQRK